MLKAAEAMAAGEMEPAAGAAPGADDGGAGRGGRAFAFGGADEAEVSLGFDP